MDNGTCLVARLPTTIAGPPRLKTNSEVATMVYCKLNHVHIFLGGVAAILIATLYSTIEDLTSDTKNPRLE